MKCRSCKKEMPDGAMFCCYCGQRLKKDKTVTSVPKPEYRSGSYRIYLRKEKVNITAPTEKECIARARAIRDGYLDASKPDKITLGKAIDDYIMDREAVLSPSTLAGYDNIRANRLQEYMNKSIASVNWQAVINRESRKYSPKTIRNEWGLIRAAASAAGVELEEVRLPQKQIVEKAFLEPEQIPIFLDAIKGKPCEIAALLALSSLRSSEVLGLEWEGVDLINRRIHVHGAVVQGRGHKPVEKATNKNASSDRYIPIFIPQLYAALNAVEDKRGKVYHHNQNTLYRQIKAVTDAAGLPNIGVHGLRHSFASLCYSLNVPEKIVMSIGGWADNQTMRRIYTHLAQKDVNKYSQELRDFFAETLV